MKRLYITIGDPRGIGADIIMRSLRDVYSSSVRPFESFIVGDRDIVHSSARQYGIRISELGLDSHAEPGSPVLVAVESKDHPGADSLQYIDRAVSACLEKKGSALVTGPVTKEAVAEKLPGFMGHTEYLADITGSPMPVMAFISDRLRMSLLTTHLPLSDIAGSIDTDLIVRHFSLLCDACRDLFSLVDAPVVLCSLNPHSGENGLLGTEEKDIFEPAVRELRMKNIKMYGPMGSAEALCRTLSGEFGFLVSPYHDQVLTAMKVFLAPSVNLTLGLPFIRTSPDHGPAIDLNAACSADYASMKAAIELALSLGNGV